MKNNNQDIWVGTEQLENEPAYLESVNQEFYELPIVDQMSDDRAANVKTNRRDFLKYLGFGLGAATVAAGCDIPVRKAIPYVTKPDTIVPGVATYYASSFVNGGDYCSILVKTREGRPIKIEGNPMSSITKGGTSARVQASVLGLYDTKRYQSPMKKGADGMEATTWAEVDKAVTGLSGSATVRVVTNTNMSPTAKKALGEFTAKYPNAKVVTYDAVSSSAILEANEESFGLKTVPDYHFDKADVIVSFGADFLGTWVSPIEYARKYAAGRKITDVKNAKISRHIQVESGMTLTGSNADNRILVKPSETGAAIATLYNALGGSVSAPNLNAKAKASIQKVADQLKAANGKALVVSGSNNVGEQILVNAINNMLGSYGSTISFANASNQRQGIDSEIQGLVGEMEGGSVDAVIVCGANPSFDLPNSDKFNAAFAKVGLKVSLATSPNETAANCDYIAPAHHQLESWGDAEPKAGHYSLVQPTISPLFDTRQAEESFLVWAVSTNLDSRAEQPYYEYLKANWSTAMFAQQSDYLSAQSFWDAALHDGIFEVAKSEPAVTFSGNASAAAGKISQPSAADLEIGFYETVNLGAGQYSNNPWLMEMPDPIMRTVWGNYLAFPIIFDGDRRFDGWGPFSGLNNSEFTGHADIIGVDINGTNIELTGVRQFGQMHGTAAIALGYGRTVAGQCGENVGVNVYPLLSIDANGNTQYYSTKVGTPAQTGVDHEFACVQYHHTMGVKGKLEGSEEEINVDEQAMMTLGTGLQGELVDRSIIFHGNVSEIGKLEAKMDKFHHDAEHLNEKTLYPYEEYKEQIYDQGHHWGMSIDMNACTGCGACQVACVAENNVPVVGKYEVFRHHEMTWLRIDRYYYGDYENPSVVYQPMLCQHCDNAPCENVCPVAATNHSSEGLNQMAYNRCIGTRYCANNCPYKVRRFNWMDYTTADLFPSNEPLVNGEEVPFYADNLTRMVLNPDVTVRARGVMEKCSFCVQRIQEAKLTAKKEMRGLKDGDVKSACQTACPTGAIVFGDTNDKNSAVSKALKNPLNYHVLEEINLRSSVAYTAVVHNQDEELV